jgi:hypothetical protein
MLSGEEIKAFAEFCRLTGRNAQDYSSPNPPDFLSKEHGIAVELTSYHQDQMAKGSNVRKADESAKKLVESAKNKYQKVSDVRVDVFVHMHHSWMAKPRNFDRCANELAEVVILHGKEEVDLERSDLPDELKNVVSWVSISPTPSGKDESLWQSASAASIEVNIAAVQASLKEKEAKIANYRPHAPRVELLIYSSPWPCVGVLNMGNASSCGGITDELRDFVFESSFDKVHYLDLQERRLVELKLKKLSVI